MTISHHPCRSAEQPVRRRTPHHRHQRGAALLEMAIAVGLLSLLLFGIITFGVTLSYKQSMTQATNEAARAAAVAPPGLARTRAEAAANRATSGFGTPCNSSNGLTCTFIEGPCDGDPTLDCMTVELTYALRTHPRVPSIGAISSTLPETLVSRAVVQINKATTP